MQQDGDVWWTGELEDVTRPLYEYVVEFLTMFKGNERGRSFWVVVHVGLGRTVRFLGVNLGGFCAFEYPSSSIYISYNKGGEVEVQINLYLHLNFYNKSVNRNVSIYRGVFITNSIDMTS